MSGGVDSSVAAFLIKNQGYYVEGITLKLCSTNEDEPSCCTTRDIEDAKAVCQRLDIPHRVINFTDNFNWNDEDKYVWRSRFIKKTRSREVAENLSGRDEHWVNTRFNRLQKIFLPAIRKWWANINR